MGCGIDIGIIDLGEQQNPRYKTCLIEVNDGFSLGVYPPLTAKDYADLLICRWGNLINLQEVVYIKQPF